MTGQDYLDLFFIGKEVEWRYKLDRYEDSAIKELIKVYENAKVDILRAVRSGNYDDARAETLLRDVENMLTGLRIQSGMAIAEVATLAGKQALFEYQDLLSVEGRIANFNFTSLTSEQIAAGVEEPVGGQLLNEWLTNSFDTRIMDNIKSEIGTGLAKGSGFKDIFWRLMDNGVNMSRDDAITIARTYVQSVNTRAQETVYEANKDIVKKLRWTATFENSNKDKGTGTCLTCAALDGQEWATNDKKRPPMPKHPRCRCTWVPVTVSYRELGLDIDELRRAARPYTIREDLAIDEGGTRAIQEVGQHQGSWESWMKSRSADFQKDALGPGRYQLWKDGKISLHDMVDHETGRLLRLDELTGGRGQVGGGFVPAKTLDEAISNVKKYAKDVWITDEAIKNGNALEWLNGLEESRIHLSKYTSKADKSLNGITINIRDSQNTAATVGKMLIFDQDGAPGLKIVDDFNWFQKQSAAISGSKVWAVSETDYGASKHELIHRIDNLNSVENPALRDEWYDKIAPKYDTEWRQKHISAYAGSGDDRRGNMEFLAESGNLYTQPGYKKGYLPDEIEKYLDRFFK